MRFANGISILPSPLLVLVATARAFDTGTFLRILGSGQAVAAGQFLLSERVAGRMGSERHVTRQCSALGGSQGIELFHGISP